jgi:hypothetical protein
MNRDLRFVKSRVGIADNYKRLGPSISAFKFAIQCRRDEKQDFGFVIWTAFIAGYARSRGGTCWRRHAQKRSDAQSAQFETRP